MAEKTTYRASPSRQCLLCFQNDRHLVSLSSRGVCSSASSRRDVVVVVIVDIVGGGGVGGKCVRVSGPNCLEL